MTKAEYQLHLLNSNPKNKQILIADDLKDTLGIFINAKDKPPYLSLSDDNEWSFFVKCPKCEEATKITKENVNTIISCSCGQALAAVVRTEESL